MRPFPTEMLGARTAQKRLEEHRDPFCEAYNTCLTFAARKDWDDWTCERCPHYQRDHHPSATQFARDQPHPFE